jgi:hypothetical protein
VVFDCLEVNAMGSRAGWIVRAVVLIALTRPAHAETDSQTQTVIRGSGNDVSIVYRSSATARPHGQPIAHGRAAAAAVDQETPLTQAARMKSQGASDDSIVAYLRIHQADLPTVVSTEAVDQLRQAGVGRPVIATLSTLTAVEIGETGEGAELVMMAPDYGAADMNGAAGYADGYYGGGYYGGYGGVGGWRGRFAPGGRFLDHRHAFFPGLRPPGHLVRPMPLPSGHMAMGRGMPAHAARGGMKTR